MEEPDYKKSGWILEEWCEMQKKLEQLSLEEIRILADKVGVQFENSNLSVVDRPQMSAKEEFIMVFDEIPKKILMREFNNLEKNKQTKK